jgi:fumarate reductase flavoprotein subunit
VVGIEASAKGGKKFTIQAKKAVVLATGGFAGDFNLYDRILLDFRGGYSTCSPYATGDGMLAAQKIGADVTHLNLCAPYASGLEINPGKRMQPFTVTPLQYSKVGGMYVNKLGKRFCDEAQPLSFVGLESLPKQPDKIDYYIFDSVMAEQWRADKSIIFSSVIHEDIMKKEEKLAKSGGTIEELAKKINIDPATLADTVAKFNSYVDAKKDPEFGRKKLMDLKIEKPPFYALGPMKDNVVLVLGGLRANAKGQVVDPFGKVIPGLYTAGELMGGVHGSKYYGGTAIGKAFTFGYLTGKNAAAEKV